MKVIIVGAGLVGLAVADELTRRGAGVELFERNPSPGMEASQAAAGFLSPQEEVGGPGPFLDLLLKAYQLIPETVTRLEALTRIDLKYRANGMLELAFSESDEEEWSQRLAWQEKAGLRFERLTPSQVKLLEPAVDGKVRAGVWWPEAAQVDNVALVEAYRRAVMAQGGIFHAGISVTRFLVHGDQVVGVETGDGTAQADWVIACSGCWAGFDADFPLPIPTFPVKGQILQYRTETSLVSRVVASPRAYLVQRAPHQLIVGTTVERVGFDKTVTEEGRRSIVEGAAQICSRLAGWAVERAWAGLRPGTPDGLPILGPTPLRRFLVAAGHFRKGILLAPLTGRLMADLVTAGSCGIDLSPFSVTRFLAKTVPLI